MDFSQFVMSYEAPIRLGFFLGIFAVMALWEWRAPRRTLSVSKVLRWANNLGLVFLNTLLLRALFPAAAVGMAVFAHSRGWGLFNYFETPYALAVLASVVVLDFVIYLQHVMFHAVPALWRLHRVHHADLDIDVTTGARFHPIEIILSMLIKFAAIAVLGAPVLAVVIFEVLLNATAMFNHSNVRMPGAVDTVLRWLVVTPDMHRVHHSVEQDEANSNFGFNLPWWDRLLGTYRPQPRAGHEAMTIGIDTFRDPKHCDNLWGMLVLPFVGKITGYAINRREWVPADEPR
ncbi:MAG: sterol desaturase family protein [Gammaproteobacteria bacterium]|nr:MAG: sterol desaturase family protein [Gammaproteobacteria bacterium]